MAVNGKFADNNDFPGFYFGKYEIFRQKPLASERASLFEVNRTQKKSCERCWPLNFAVSVAQSSLVDQANYLT